MYRSTDVLNVVDTTTGTQNTGVKRLALYVLENIN
jgi:hypothetical protein